MCVVNVTNGSEGQILVNSLAFPLRDGSVLILLHQKKQLEFLNYFPESNTIKSIKKYTSAEGSVFTNEILNLDHAMARPFKSHFIGIISARQSGDLASSGSQMKIYQISYDGVIQEIGCAFGDSQDNGKIKIASLNHVSGKYFQGVLFNSTPALIKLQLSRESDTLTLNLKTVRSYFTRVSNQFCSDPALMSNENQSYAMLEIPVTLEIIIGSIDIHKTSRIQKYREKQMGLKNEEIVRIKRRRQMLRYLQSVVFTDGETTLSKGGLAIRKLPKYNRKTNPFFISYNNCLNTLYLHNSANLEVRKLECHQVDLSQGFTIEQASSFKQKTVSDFYMKDKDSVIGKYMVVCMSKQKEMFVLRFSNNI